MNQLPHGSGVCDLGPDGLRALEEERDRVSLVHRLQVEFGLATHMQRLAARREDVQRRCRGEQLGERFGRVGQELLEVVEHDVSPPVAEAGRDRSRGVTGRTDSFRDQRHDERGVAHRRQRDEHRAAVCLLGEKPCQLDRESCLPRTARSDDRQHARSAVEPQRGGGEQLALPAEERRDGRRQVDRSRRADGRELLGTELEQLRRSVEILEPVETKVEERLVLEQGGGRCRHQHLPSVRERGDARTAVHVDPDVALGRDGRSPGVQPHPDDDRTGVERALAGPSCSDRSGSSSEGDEECVSLGVDFNATVLLETSSEDRAVDGELARVRLGTDVFQQACRAGDVGEEERDRSRRQLGAHKPSIAKRRDYVLAVLELAHACGECLEQRPRDLRVLLDEGPELPRRQPVAHAVARRGDRRGARPAADQRDLAEVVAGTERATLLALDGDVGLARLDHEEPGGTLTLCRQLLAGLELAVGEVRRERLQLAIAQLLEERDTLDEFDGSSHARILNQRETG